MNDFFDSTLFTFVFLPLFIFLSRIVDVTLDTLRIVFITRGNRKLAPILGFFEVLIWIIAITRVMQNLDNWLCYVAYAGGFASGNYIGLLIEEKLAMGIRAIRMFCTRNTEQFIQNLNDADFRPTIMQGAGKDGPVTIIFLLVRRNDLKRALQLIYLNDSEMLYTIEDVRTVNKGIKPFSKFEDSSLTQRMFQRQSR